MSSGSRFLLFGSSTGTSRSVLAAWSDAIIAAGRELSRELPNTSGVPCSVNAPARAVAECKRALSFTPSAQRAAAASPFPGLQRRGLHTGHGAAASGPVMGFESGSGAPEHSFVAPASLHSREAADVGSGQSRPMGVVTGDGAEVAGPQRPPQGATGRPDLAALAQQWRSVAAKAQALSRQGSGGLPAESSGSGGGGSGGADGQGAGGGRRWNRKAYESLVGPTCEALDSGPHHFVHAYRHLPSGAGGATAGEGGAPAVLQHASRSMDVAALVDVVGSAVALNRLAAFKPTWDFRRSLVAAATEAVRGATWPQAAALLRDMVALQSVGRVFLDRVLARIGLALYKEAHFGEAAVVHGALRAAFRHGSTAGTGRGTLNGRYGTGGGRDVDDGSSMAWLRVAHYRRAFSRQLARAGQPPLSDADILAGEAAVGAEEAASMLSSMAAVWRGGVGDVPAGSERVSLPRQMGGPFRWLMAYLPPLLPALPGGPAAVLPLLRELTSCGWDHSSDTSFLDAVADHLASPARPAASAGAGPAGGQLPDLVPPPPVLAGLSPGQLVEVLECFARVGLHHELLMERALDAAERGLHGFTASQAARMAVVCARFSHTRPALLRRMAHHVGAALPAAVPPGDVAATVVALARAGQREERFLALAAAYGKQHAEARLAVMELEAHAVGGGAAGGGGGGGGGAAAVQQRPAPAAPAAVAGQVRRSGRASSAGSGAVAVAGAEARPAGPAAARDSAGGGGGGEGSLPVRAPWGESRVLSGAAARARAADEDETSRTAAAQVAAQAAAVVAMAQMTVERRGKGLPPGLLAGGADAAGGDAAVGSCAAPEADAGAARVDVPLGGATTAPWGTALAEAPPPPFLPAADAAAGAGAPSCGAGEALRGSAAAVLAGIDVPTTGSPDHAAAAAPAIGAWSASRGTAAADEQGCGERRLEAEAPAGAGALEVPEAVVLEELFAAEAAADAAWQARELAAQPPAHCAAAPSTAGIRAHTDADTAAEAAVGTAGSPHMTAADAMHAPHGPAEAASPGPGPDAEAAPSPAGARQDSDAAAAADAEPALEGTARYRRRMGGNTVAGSKERVLDPRTVLMIGNVQFSTTPIGLLQHLRTTAAGGQVHTLYMPYDTRLTALRQPNKGIAYVAVDRPDHAAAIKAWLCSRCMPGRNTLANVDYMNWVPHGNALLSRRVLKDREGEPVYASPPDGPHLWPLLLYTNHSLRGQIQPLDPRDTIMHELLLPSGAKFRLSRKAAADANSSSSSSSCSSSREEALATATAATAPTLLTAEHLAAAAYSMCVVSYVHAGLLGAVGQLMTSLMRHVLRDPAAAAAVLPPPDVWAGTGGSSESGSSADGPCGAEGGGASRVAFYEEGLRGHNCSAQPLDPLALLDKTAQAHWQRPEVRVVAPGDDLTPDQRAARAAGDKGHQQPRLGPHTPQGRQQHQHQQQQMGATAELPPLKAALHALYAMAHHPQPDAAAWAQLADSCAVALHGWLPPDLPEPAVVAVLAAAERAPLAGSGGQPPPVPQGSALRAAGAAQGDPSDGDVTVVRAASGCAGLRPGPAHAALPPYTPLPSPIILDVYLKLLAQALSAAADSRLPPPAHAALAAVAAGLLRCHMPRMRARAACELVQALVRLRHPDSGPLVRAVAPLLVQQSARLSPSSLASLAWACARTGACRDEPGVVSQLARRTRQLIASDGLPTGAAVQLFWALSALQYDDRPALAKAGSAAGDASGREGPLLGRRARALKQEPWEREAAAARRRRDGDRIRDGSGVYAELLQLLLNRCDLAARDLLLLQEAFRSARAQQQLTASAIHGSDTEDGTARPPLLPAMPAFLEELVSSASKAAAHPRNAGGAGGGAEAERAGGANHSRWLDDSPLFMRPWQGRVPGTSGPGAAPAAAAAPDCSSAALRQPDECVSVSDASHAIASTARVPSGEARAAAGGTVEMRARRLHEQEQLPPPPPPHGAAVHELLEHISAARRGLALEEVDGLVVQLQVPDSIDARTRGALL